MKTPITARPDHREQPPLHADNASPKPVLWRLLPSLAVMVILLIVGAVALLWQEHRQGLASINQTDVSGVSGNLRIALDQQAIGLAAATQSIAADASVQKGLRDGDADRLLAAWRPVFERLHRENHLTHFYFFDKNRICLLRVHEPNRRGDRSIGSRPVRPSVPARPPLASSWGRWAPSPCGW